MPRTLGPLVRVLAVLVLLTSAAGCTGGDAEERPPEEVLAEAKSHLDDTTGVRIRLKTPELPPEVNGVLSAQGVGTHDPAFKGDLTVSSSGITADVPVVAVGGQVFARLPFTTEYVEVDPASYGAPDPAGLMDPDQGLSALLTAAEDVEAGKDVRSGEEVLSSFSGKVPGEAVSSIIPGAASGEGFEARFTVDGDTRLREAVLTGPFYPEAAEVTYTVTFEDYGTDADINAP